MCGVAGILQWEKDNESLQATVTQMLTMIKHRGPDESGIFVGDRVCIGNVRLSIIDLSSGQQPMCDNEQNLWIVFNGEIFNYIELRKELRDRGVQFKTESDTEVLLYLFKEFGPAGLHKLNGQFVFAIWNIKERELFIARDRVGIRPLFYTTTKQGFVFGSEIKAVAAHPEVQPEFDFQVLAQVFTMWAHLPGKSVFSNILELEPGSYMVVKDQKITKTKFWDIPFCNQGEYITTNFNDALEQFSELFQSSVALRLRSDVPVAAYLSGGLDSSITTAFIKDISPGNLQTFSIGFSDKDYDETSFQQEVSQYLNTQHVSFTCTPADIAESFEKVVWHSEIPLMRTAPAPMFLLSKKVREQNIKVVITGEGADEILAGYDIFKESQIRRFWARFPDSKYRPMLLKRLYPYIPQLQNMNTQMLRFVFGFKLSETTDPFYGHLLRWNNGSMVRNFLNPDIKNKLANYNPAEQLENELPAGFGGWDWLSKSQWVESKILMSNYLLSSQGDRMGMGNSIEGRYPFLDYRIVEFCAKLPPQFKLNGLTEKFLLKKLMQGKLPQSVVNRSKQAYRAPIISAFFSPQSPGYVQEFLSEKKIKDYGIFDYATVNKLVDKFNGSKIYSESDTMAVTAILSTQMVYSMFVENNYKPAEYNQLLKPNIIKQNNTLKTILL